MYTTEYFSLFNTISDALELLEEGNIDAAAAILKAAEDACAAALSETESFQ